MDVNNYSYLHQMEGNFDDDTYRGNLVNKWTDSLWCSLIYIILVFSVQEWMNSRKKFDLRPALIIWNLLFGLFSTVGFVRMLPALSTIIFEEPGTRVYICTEPISKGPVGFWSFWMCISKLLEFGDTLFIVLRKQNLIFLHWYHHIVTCVFAWYSYSSRMSISVYVTAMNLAVHAIMYTYYAFKAMRLPVPRAISMIITTIQLSQMVVGFSLFYFGYTEVRRNSACWLKEEFAIAGILMYASYFCLFGHFFYKTYLSKSRHIKQH